MIDIAIVGAGPAGYSAAITARKRDKSVVVIGQHTGWLSRAHSISNYPGMPDISGADLLNAMRDQAVALGAQTRPGVVHQIVSMGSSFALSLGGDFIEAKHIILCTGAKQPRLLPGESELLGRGVHLMNGLLVHGVQKERRACAARDREADAQQKRIKQDKAEPERTRKQPNTLDKCRNHRTDAPSFCYSV